MTHLRQQMPPVVVLALDLNHGTPQEIFDSVEARLRSEGLAFEGKDGSYRVEAAYDELVKRDKVPRAPSHATWLAALGQVADCAREAGIDVVSSKQLLDFGRALMGYRASPVKLAERLLACARPDLADATFAPVREGIPA
ncbi:MAG: hypothetical protein HY744_25205 [Deltaproteobacteria bacterium]|nr:hypothetical protein [Deltaproteobacteria bacterium]